MRIVLALLVSCSAPDDVREPRPMLGARLVCSDVSPSCFGDIHATFYATTESRERVVASVLESFAESKIDETNEDPTATAIAWHDTTILVYEPESASDWFKTTCAVRDDERTVIDVGYVSR